ncbi:MAG: hypothetical protein E6Q27_09420 [Aeromicrobium sp.]|nr:MAG: hypothetical protein E6Q27_09420 [Aeromicrobium sp.]
MRAFRTWLIAGFLGALCTTLWLGAFAFGDVRWWHMVLSISTFIAGVVVLTWKLRPSQVAHAVPATSVGYAIGWDVVQERSTEGIMNMNPYFVAIMAVALATFVATVTSKVREGQAKTDEPAAGSDPTPES